jgi:RNA polymerase sigma factor (sigma-70 family)
MSKKREENNRLFPLVRDGDRQARDQMIELNRPLVTFKVTKYLEQFPQCTHLRDDLLSSGTLALVEAVCKIAAGEHDGENVTAYINKWIHFGVGNVVDIEGGVRIPGRTQRKKKKEGTPLQTFSKVSDLEHNFLDTDGLQDPMAVPDLMDEINGLATTPRDKEYVRLKLLGYRDSEVAKKLGVSKGTVFNIKQRLYEQFLERNPEYQQ